ncbi:MAG: hypothetical protein LBT55_03765 [Clostridiaceae bacterium]|jgi:acetyl-CoA carboxylase carboxyltransferase component|nr:hypothetical protein [Clostridiaceae bacterium]
MDILKRFDDNTSKILNAGGKIRAFLDELTDKQSFVEWDVFLSGKDEVSGADALGEGVITGYATIDGWPVYLFLQNYEVKSGGFSLAQGKKIVKAIDKAVKAGIPFVSVIDSAGARLGEGIGVLEGYGSVIAAASELAESVPHIAVIKGPAVGVMSAYASLADFVFVSEKDGYASLNAPMAVTAAAGKAVPSAEAFGAKALTAGGLADFTFADAKSLSVKLSELFSYLYDTEESEDDLNRTEETVNSAYSAEAAIKAVADGGNYLKLKGGYAPEIITALAKIGGRTVGFLATDIAKNGGYISKKGISKATGFVKLLSAIGAPLITLTDSLGAEISLSDELSGLAAEAGALLKAVASSTSFKIAVIAGKAIGFAYLAFASKGLGYDYSLAFAGAAISPLNPETAVEVEFSKEIASAKDPAAARTKLLKKYNDELADPFVSAKDGYVDNIIEPKNLRPYLASILETL